jgi:hypothetical protein
MLLKNVQTVIMKKRKIPLFLQIRGNKAMYYGFYFYLSFILI